MPIIGNVLFLEAFVAAKLSPFIRVMRPEASFLVWLDCTGLGLDGAPGKVRA